MWNNFVLQYQECYLKNKIKPSIKYNTNSNNINKIIYEYTMPFEYLINQLKKFKNRKYIGRTLITNFQLQSVIFFVSHKHLSIHFWGHRLHSVHLSLCSLIIHIPPYIFVLYNTYFSTLPMHKQRSLGVGVIVSFIPPRPSAQIEQNIFIHRFFLNIPIQEEEESLLSRTKSKITRQDPQPRMYTNPRFLHCSTTQCTLFFYYFIMDSFLTSFRMFIREFENTWRCGSA